MDNLSNLLREPMVTIDCTTETVVSVHYVAQPHWVEQTYPIVHVTLPSDA